MTELCVAAAHGAGLLEQADPCRHRMNRRLSPRTHSSANRADMTAPILRQRQAEIAMRGSREVHSATELPTPAAHAHPRGHVDDPAVLQPEQHRTERLCVLFLVAQKAPARSGTWSTIKAIVVSSTGRTFAGRLSEQPTRVYRTATAAAERTMQPDSASPSREPAAADRTATVHDWSEPRCLTAHSVIAGRPLGRAAAPRR